MYLVLLLTLGLVLTLSHGKDCDDLHFYDLETLKCIKCKTCKQFEVTVAECSQNNDTVCYSLTYFKPPTLKEIQRDLKEEWIRQHGHRKKEDTKTQEDAILVPKAKSDTTNWRTLSYGLMAVLGCLALVTTVILLLLWKKSQCVMKQYDNLELQHGDDTDYGNEYVVFERIPTRITSYDEENSNIGFPRPIRGSGLIDNNVRRYSRYYRKRLYKPIRRLLPEGVDDVFESEDSNGSRSLRLDTIPERSDSDIDDLNLDNQKQSSEKSITDSKKSFKEALSCENNVQNPCCSGCSTGKPNCVSSSQSKDLSNKDTASLHSV